MFVISGARSGSTTIGHYLDSDNELISPSGIMTMFPFLWLWWLVRKLSNYHILPSQKNVTSKVLQLASVHAPEFIARHEFDPFRPDTFEVPWLVNRHFYSLAYELGADSMLYNGPISDRKEYGGLWDDFDRYIHDIMLKTIYFNGSSSRHRVMIKGHFLAAASTLEVRYSDATFVTVVREPSKRLVSLMNFVLAAKLAMGTDVMGVPTKLNLLDVGEAITRLEVDYGVKERDFFVVNRDRKVVVKFEEYVENPVKAMEGVYGVVGKGRGGGVPEEVLEALVKGREGHKGRSKVEYNIKLEAGEFGVDEKALKGCKVW